MSGNELDSPKKMRDEKRFEVSRKVVWIDFFMQKIIKFGGMGVILAICGIFVFIFVQILPLFKGAEVKEISTTKIPEKNYVALGVDQWSELPFLLDHESQLHFIDLKNKSPLTPIPIPLPQNSAITACRYQQQSQTLALGLEGGEFTFLDIRYEQSFDESNHRKIQHSIHVSPIYPIGTPGVPIKEIEYADSGEQKIVAIIQKVDHLKQIHLVTLSQRQTLLGAGEIEIDTEFDITSQIEGDPKILRVGGQADSLLVATQAGRIYYFDVQSDECSLVQEFRPFDDLSDPGIQSMDLVFGGVSLVLTSNSGENRVFSLLIPENTNTRVFKFTKEFKKLPNSFQLYAPSLRNKAFLIGTQNSLSLRFVTTETIRWEEEFDIGIEHAVISSKFDKIIALDNSHQLRVFNLYDPHPEAGFNAYFQKLWYEGSSKPKYEWQSTGATDDYEPKLSLIPLIIGTLKGTFYAMLFATPIALMAALYTSQFLHWKVRLIVKPTMEIMASLPSVVLGFLAALWLAPIVETNLVFILLLLVLLPIISMLFGQSWSSVPIKYRKMIKPGNEFIVVFLIIFITSWGCWQISPLFENSFFTVLDPLTNEKVGNFQRWWRKTTNMSFEQRNAMVVGFVMGFAVIPIIFSIAEESLSNVPKSMTSGALALGASRWQTAIRVVLPTGSPGIFSALMIGLGRAVGETMIVLMATGNTPVLDFNIFSGMRTLSANIAVELPEAPHEGTLYRTLFLGALILFMFTFVLNTFAEVLRQYLREKYKTV